jgi:hypothetical protein
MKTGDLVKIRDEWQPDGIIYIITEWNDDRGFISPVEWDAPIRPNELVHSWMIQTLTETTQTTAA